MTSEVEESSAPTTPTLSSVAPSDVSLDDLQPLTDASSQVSDDELELHPTLFIREDMVSIRVQRTLFRIPSFYLSHDSRYFSQLFSKHTRDQTVYIRDADVTSSGFANLLRVIRPPLGTSPLITLAEWTDVLHLSSKWGFEDLRTASLAAIPPLASPVDKLVLARTYSLTDWISSAYADLLEREEDLTEEEAERMTIKDIVAIAKGRRAIRAPGKVEPRSVIEKAVESLVPSYKDKQRHGSLLVSPIDFVTPPSSVPVAMTQTPDDSHLLVSRWLDQLTLPVLADSAQTCLIKFVLADRARVPLMLDMIMQRCFRAFKSNYQNALSRFSFSQISLPEIDLGQWDARIYNLNQRTPGGMFNGNNTREAALRVIDQWSALRRVCQDGGQRLTVTTSSQEWQDLMNGIMFLCRCCSTPSHSSAIIDRSVFAGFWSTLLMVLMSTAPHQIPSVARLLHALLAELKMRGVQNIKCAEVHWEMDAFYRAVKDARLKAQDAKDSDYVDVVKALDRA